MNAWSFMIAKTLNFFIKTSNFEDESNKMKCTFNNIKHFKRYGFISLKRISEDRAVDSNPTSGLSLFSLFSPFSEGYFWVLCFYSLHKNQLF